MDTETFILSVRERRPVWDQRAKEHHNRYILDRLWKEIGQENRCTFKEAQKKWKGLRDYYRSEFRKTQKERSGQGAETVYKPNWPYFMSLDFLRDQFLARPSSGNIKAEKRKADEAGIAEAGENISDSPNIPDNDEDETLVALTVHSGADETLVVPSKSIPSVETTSLNINSESFTHPNDFRRRTFKQDQMQKLLKIEEKKLSILVANENKNSDDEDSKFFDSLKPHLKMITGMNKLLFRNEVQNLVMKYAYSRREIDSPAVSTPNLG